MWSLCGRGGCQVTRLPSSMPRPTIRSAMIKTTNHEPRWYRGILWPRTIVKWIMVLPVVAVVIGFYVIANLILILPWAAIAWIWNTEDQDLLVETLTAERDFLCRSFGPTKRR